MQLQYWCMKSPNETETPIFAFYGFISKVNLYRFYLFNVSKV